MTERKVTETTDEQRDVMTLFVTVAKQQILTRTFRAPWRRINDPHEDPNLLGRRVEREFRDFCKEWGVSEASALTVYEIERRTTRLVTETEITTDEIIRNTYEHQEASA